VIESAIMQIQRGIQFGRLYQQLEIDANSPVSYQVMPTGLIIWDLATGVQYKVNPPNVAQARFDVPQWVKEILAASNEELKKRWTESSMDGWSEERETIFTELTCRGVRMLDL